MALPIDDALTGPCDVALFPLPNVVLFPRAILPLHIFEPRYRQMTADALAGDKQIAMALLTGRRDPDDPMVPAIAPVVCVGTIIEHQLLEDGRYNLLLRGHTRAVVTGEDRSRPYRVGTCVPLVESAAMEIDLDEPRRRLRQVVQRRAIADTPAGRQLAEVIESHHVPTAVAADLIAFHLLEDVALRQALLEEPDVRARVARLATELAAAFPELPAAPRITDAAVEGEG
jgi:Lon protease-like protein